MNLAAILAFCGLEQIQAHIELQTIQLDSRMIKSGDLFIAVPGLKVDGRDYIQQAITNGAAAVLAESPYKAEKNLNNTTIISISDLKTKLAKLSAFFYQYPARDLKLIGITGTNGKTSCSHYVAQILSTTELCGVMGTIGNGLLANLTPSQLTTGDCCTTQQQFAEFKRLNAKYVAMEISSHALAQERLVGLEFDTAIFTNLSQDHLDYHANMQEYFAAKVRLFRDFNTKNCVINLDDIYGEQLLNLVSDNKNIKIITYGLSNAKADVYLENNKIHTPWGTGVLNSPLLGDFNISNLLACIAACALQGMALELILKTVSNLIPVTGRMQKVASSHDNAPLVVVDYAHTPDALSKALQALRPYTNGKIHCIFGCGGDRDRTKRPLMLRAALENSDKIVITQDNPRTEDPQQILKDILQDQIITTKISIELDRAIAIQKTIAQASDQDLVLIAGKGHENYQIIGEQKNPFSDLLVAQQALAVRSENVWTV